MFEIVIDKKVIKWMLEGDDYCGISLYPRGVILPPEQYRGRGCSTSKLRFKTDYKPHGKEEQHNLTNLRYLWDEMSGNPNDKAWDYLETALPYISSIYRPGHYVIAWYDTARDDFIPNKIKMKPSLMNIGISPSEYKRLYQSQNDSKYQKLINEENIQISYSEYQYYKQEPYFERAVTLYKKKMQEKKEINKAVKQAEQALLNISKNIKGIKGIKLAYHCPDIESNNFVDFLGSFSSLEAEIQAYNDLVQNNEMFIIFQPKDYNTIFEVYERANQIKKNRESLQFALEEKTFKENQEKILKDFENDTYIIVIPKTHQECIAYGSTMHNYLGNYEWNSYLRNGKRAVFLVKEKSSSKLVACIDGNTNTLKYKFKRKQALAPRNEPIRNGQIKNFIQAYIAYINEKEN
jgi:hypothetical protein